MARPADTFAQDNLPPEELWPEFDFSHPAYRYPDRLNCVGFGLACFETIFKQNNGHEYNFPTK